MAFALVLNYVLSWKCSILRRLSSTKQKGYYSFWNSEWQNKLFAVVMQATISLENLVQQGLQVCNLIPLRPLQ